VSNQQQGTSVHPAAGTTGTTGTTAGREQKSGKKKPVAAYVLRASALAVLVALGLAIGVLLPTFGISPSSILASNIPALEKPGARPEVAIDPLAEEYDPSQPPAPARSAQPAKSIQIPGYGQIPMAAGSRDIAVNLLNPAGNPCYFNFELVLASTHEVLYSSGAVAPGDAIRAQRLAHTLDVGEHDVLIRIKTTSLQTLEPMNGAEVKTQLVVG
jgi:hypothetical protein